MRKFRSALRWIRENPESFQIVIDGVIILSVITFDLNTPLRRVLGVILLVSAFVSFRRQVH
ncbi:MAG TPA: hypothetical protein PLH22_00950 [Candidatus Colwellbacteria bacterium]|nr:hypothetical protein [Candidatus Colwellbacteria bacterium]